MKPFHCFGIVLRYAVAIDGVVEGRCCATLSEADSHLEFMRLNGVHEQAVTRPLPHHELVQLHGFAAQARITVDLVGQGHDLARAA